MAEETPLEQHAQSHKTGGSDPIDWTELSYMKVQGYDYTGLVRKDVAVDPTTKALLVKGFAGAGATDHGTLTGLADDDHTHYMKIAGETMTGALVLHGAPAADLEAATKKYVDDMGGGGAHTLESHSAYKLDILEEYTPGAGVTVDDCLVKDGLAADSHKLEGHTLASVQNHTPKAHALSAHGAAVADITMDSQKVINLADPTNNQDAATKAYVDAVLGP